MTHPSLTILREEHAALAAMLRSIPMLLDQQRRRGQPVPFDVLRAMLLYVDEFPERLHHPKESRWLFPAVRRRSDAAAEVLDRLERDHERGERAVRELEHELLAYEVLGEPRREAFEQALRRYVDGYLEHMRLEEAEVLPLAEQVLTADDWRELDAAFLANRDPLTGHEPQEVYRPLFERIVRRAPAPVGLG
jgi:hemerythrin-like domain-containing protein